MNSSGKLVKILVGLFVFFVIVLGIEGFIFYKLGGPKARRQSPLEIKEKIILASEYPGFSLSWVDKLFLEQKLNEFGFWQENGVAKEGELERVTVKKLVINFTDKEQTFDKIFTKGFDGPIRSVGSLFDEETGTLRLNVHVSRALLPRLSEDEPSLLLGIGVIRGVYILTRAQSLPAEDNSLASIEKELGNSNKVFIKAVSVKENSSDRLDRSVFAFFMPFIEDIYAAGSCEGNYWCGTWKISYQCPDGSSCITVGKPCPTGGVCTEKKECVDAGPRPCSASQSECPGHCPCASTQCCSNSGCYWDEGASPTSPPSAPTPTPGGPTPTSPPLQDCPYWCATSDQCAEAKGTVHTKYACLGTDVCCETGGGGSACDPWGSKTCTSCANDYRCWNQCDCFYCGTEEDKHGAMGLRYLGVFSYLTGCDRGWYNCGTIGKKVGESVVFGYQWWQDIYQQAGIEGAKYYVRKQGNSWPETPNGTSTDTSHVFTHTFNESGKYDVLLLLQKNWFCWSSLPHTCPENSCVTQGLACPCSECEAQGYSCPCYSCLGEYRPMNFTTDIARVFTVDVQATPPVCEFINPPSQVEVGKSYTIKVKATSQEPTMNIRKVTISRAQTNNFDATTGWREIKNITCNGQTCEGEGVWNVTSDDLTREGNKWWLACNAYYYNEDENGTNSTRCTGNPWGVPADWADCWPPYSGNKDGIDADAYTDKDSREVAVCQNIAPGAPTNPSPANDVDLNALPSSLSWRAPDSWGVCCPGHNNHYLVYLDDNSDFSSPVINGASTTATSYSLSGKVEAGKTYYWKVVAHNGCLTTPTPHTVWSFCINKAPNAASGLIPQGQSYPDNRNITLSWGNLADDKWGLNCAGNTNRYFVYYCKKGDPNCSSDSVPNDNNKRCTPEEGVGDNNTTPIFSCTIPGPLSWESTYYWKVVTSNGALTNEAFGSFEITYPSAWWQTKTGDVYGSEIFSPIWREVPEAQRYFSLVGPFGSQSGLVAAPNCLGSSGARCNFGAAQATQTEFPASGRGGINANFTPLLNDYSYDQLAHLVDLAIKDDKQGSYNSGVKVIKSDKINKTDLVGASAGLYYYPPYGTGDMAVSLNDDNFSIGASEKLIIFVEDDLNINRNITVASGGFLAFVVKGNINIASNVTQVQGVYFANGSLTVESNGAIDSQFNGQGIFVGKNGVSLERNFRSVANTTTPTEIFTFDPAYLFTAPRVFREKPYLWQEVIP